jgi:hypothetical protein
MESEIKIGELTDQLTKELYRIFKSEIWNKEGLIQKEDFEQTCQKMADFVNKKYLIKKPDHLACL